MTKNKFKNYLDLLPLAILIVSAIVLVTKVITYDTFFFWRHIIGLAILAINIGLFFWRHQIAVLALGLTLFLGLFGVLSLSYEISITTTYFGKSEDFKIPVFHGQPIFLLWLLIHFIVSGRYYVGIVTRKYWEVLFDDLKKQPAWKKPLQPTCGFAQVGLKQRPFNNSNSNDLL